LLKLMELVKAKNLLVFVARRFYIGVGFGSARRTVLDVALEALEENGFYGRGPAFQEFWLSYKNECDSEAINSQLEKTEKSVAF
uniref:UPF0029 domain-containing protein n=1 Tax=Gongylonema pulchrum TaxID=637853 RepID=A0A183E0K1_9BILA